MIKKRDFNSIFLITYLFIMSVSFYNVWLYFSNDILIYPFYRNGNYVVVIVFIVLKALFSKIYGGFNVGEFRIVELVYAETLSTSFTVSFVYFLVGLVNRRLLNIEPYIIILLILIFISSFVVILANRFFVKYYSANKTLFIGRKEDMEYLFRKFSTRTHFINLNIESDFIDVNTDIISIFSKIEHYRSILLDIDDPRKRESLIEFAQSLNINVFIVPNLNDVLIKNSEFTHLYDIPLLKIDSETRMVMLTKILKRLLDLVISFFGLVFSFPILLIAFIMIKVEDNGPFLYKQKRLTQNHKEFSVYKIRSMIVEAESNGEAILAKENDIRITKVGAYLRRYRIDEIPQLFNVFIGEMSLVGPRPERPEIYEKIEKEIPHFRNRLKVKAGLTGYAQVYGKYNTPLKDKLIMDMEYISSISLLLDFKIILMTIKILFIKDSTEGFK